MIFGLCKGKKGNYVIDVVARTFSCGLRPPARPPRWLRYSVEAVSVVKSPCIKICAMDPRRGVCLGCCRTLEEIGAWGSMTDDERDAVMADLPRRRQALDIPEIAVPPLA